MSFYMLVSTSGLRDLRCSGVRGLCNYHMSCCVNTLLQTLSATWEVLELLEKWEGSVVLSAVDNIPLQLRSVLAAMQGDSPQLVPHRDFLHCLDRNRIRLGTQHDADEVFLFILNSFQQEIDDKTLALEVQNLFRISVETQLQCSDCSSVQTRRSFLLSLPLHIKEQCNSLKECLTSFFECQDLSGRDCCFCVECGEKKPSQKSLKLLSLPAILCIHLNRFRNLHGSTRKLDCTVTFPEVLDLSDTVKDAFSLDFTQKGCRFRLYAVVLHSGVAACGHYTAYVRHRMDQRWYYVDDSQVQQTSWEEVQTTYGGRYSKTAYMLMYRRESEELEQQPELSG